MNSINSISPQQMNFSPVLSQGFGAFPQAGQNSQLAMIGSGLSENTAAAAGGSGSSNSTAATGGSAGTSSSADLPNGAAGLTFAKAAELVKKGGGEVNPGGKPTVLALCSKTSASATYQDTFVVLKPDRTLQHFSANTAPPRQVTTGRC